MAKLRVIGTWNACRDYIRQVISQGERGGGVPYVYSYTVCTQRPRHMYGCVIGSAGDAIDAVYGARIRGSGRSLPGGRLCFRPAGDGVPRSRVGQLLSVCETEDSPIYTRRPAHVERLSETNAANIQQAARLTYSTVYVYSPSESCTARLPYSPALLVGVASRHWYAGSGDSETERGQQEVRNACVFCVYDVFIEDRGRKTQKQTRNKATTYT
ncbi:hypothetical protein GGS23DRAFT_545929 [Durotheca rogersii]|uniref:uncharacterized protein n=1 Tax=Durotheca rogersii TaxID=419775 RepID=UPI00221E644C|nr:uncharacterized protein GGS23DRAFT_545929 [Durotheca rogersii]KAI5868514.1 hypothetical protein GGS23DRAFT_545929 [Durotheca rogersii]